MSYDDLDHLQQIIYRSSPAVKIHILVTVKIYILGRTCNLYTHQVAHFRLRSYVGIRTDHAGDAAPTPRHERDAIKISPMFALEGPDNEIGA